MTLGLLGRGSRPASAVAHSSGDVVPRAALGFCSRPPRSVRGGSSRATASSAHAKCPLGAHRPQATFGGSASSPRPSCRTFHLRIHRLRRGNHVATTHSARWVMRASQSFLVMQTAPCGHRKVSNCVVRRRGTFLEENAMRFGRAIPRGLASIVPLLMALVGCGARSTTQHGSVGGSGVGGPTASGEA